MFGTRKGDVKVEVDDIVAQRIVTDGGGIFHCRWEALPGQMFVMFHTPKWNNTLMMPLYGLTPEMVKEHIEESDAKFDRIIDPPEESFLSILRSTFIGREYPKPMTVADRVWEPTKVQLRNWIDQVRVRVRGTRS
jgi:hypothetical protein